jgi:hypothetical protein
LRLQKITDKYRTLKNGKRTLKSASNTIFIFRCVVTNILNEKNLAPVHLATELNRVNALQIMGKHRSIIDIQQGGEHGRTALHLAAIYDHEECARILVSYKH